MVTQYEIGRGAEFDLLNRLVNVGYIGKRAYKSQGPYDLMMICKGLRPLLIEVKYYRVVNDKVIERLKKKVNTTKLIQIAKQVDSYPLLAFKLRRKGYLFYRLDTNVYHTVKYKELEKGLSDFLKLPPKF